MTETAAPPPINIRAALAGAMLALFLAALDQTIVATALPTMAADLGQVELLSWVVIAYQLTATAATMVFGKLADLRGRRLMMTIAIGMFLAGSLGCALAPSMPALVVARAFQGLGGGGIGVLVQTIVGDLVPPRERGRYAGYFATTWGVASIAGPTLGGLLSGTLGWPWIFWINLPLGLVALAATDRVLRRLAPVHRQSRIDWASIGLLTAASSALLLAISFAGISLPWSSPGLWALFAAGPLLTLVFVRRQRSLTDPLLPPHFWHNRVVAPMLLAIFLVFAAYVGLIILLPLFMYAVLQFDSDKIGLAMLAPMAASTITAALAGRYTKHTGRYRPPVLVGLPLTVAALLVLAWREGTAGSTELIVLFTLFSLGVGPIFPTTLTAVQNAVDRHEIGTVSGAVGLFRALGAALGAGALSAILLTLVHDGVPAAAAAGGLDELMKVKLSAVDSAAFARAYFPVFLTAAGMIAMALAIFTRAEERPLRDSLG